MLTGNAHIDIVYIDASRIFNDLDCLLQGFHDGVKVVCILQRKVAAFHDANAFAFGYTYEQVYL
jgi:hypothetical protein